MAYSPITKASDFFTPTLYVGTGSSRTISTLNFQPDWVWIKNRGTNDRHSLFDAVRAAPNMLTSNANGAQSAEPSELTAFNANGFTVNNATSVNGSSANYVSWNWKANGTGSSNTAGSINSTVSVNTTSGFSIVKYVGNASQSQTVGHGLGVAPKLIIFKSSTSADDWSICFPSVLGVDGRLTLNTSAANAIGDNTFWNSVAPSSTLFSIGNNPRANASGQTIIAYCFAEIPGFSKMGSYVGNGHANGTFAYTGFKPAFILVKNTGNSARNWQIYDNKRIGYNYNNYRIATNLPQTEESNLNIDIYSNGFKTLTTDADVNENAKTYIYMAFAEEPLVSTNGQPATAR